MLSCWGGNSQQGVPGGDMTWSFFFFSYFQQFFWQVLFILKFYQQETTKNAKLQYFSQVFGSTKYVSPILTMSLQDIDHENTDLEQIHFEQVINE